MASVNTMAVKRAAELLRENPDLKHYEAIERARRELNEVDGRAISEIYTETKE